MRSLMKEYICEVCGRSSKYPRKADGKNVCIKHFEQFKKHGKFLDNNPRSRFDLNDIWTEGETAYMGLYDQNNEIRAVVEFDREDIPKVMYLKWAYANGYAVSFSRFSGKRRQFHRVILDTDRMVDHIDGNRLNNHKSNLREASVAENNLNRPTVKGVYVTKAGNFSAGIKKDGIYYHLGVYYYRTEALWARWYAERVLFKEFARPADEPEIPERRKIDIKERVEKKILKN